MLGEAAWFSCCGRETNSQTINANCLWENLPCLLKPNRREKKAKPQEKDDKQDQMDTGETWIEENMAAVLTELHNSWKSTLRPP